MTANAFLLDVIKSRPADYPLFWWVDKIWQAEGAPFHLLFAPSRTFPIVTKVGQSRTYSYTRLRIYLVLDRVRAFTPGLCGIEYTYISYWKSFSKSVACLG